MKTTIQSLLFVLVALACPGISKLAVADEPTFAEVAVVLTKYCAGCHHVDDANGEFALDTFEALSKGGENGTALTSGSAASSRMVQMMLGSLEPTMPPEGEPAPSEEEIQLIMDWIDRGAKGPAGAARPAQLHAPKIESHVDFQPITALAISEDGQQIAVARFGKIELRDGEGKQIIRTIAELPGKITSLVFLKNNQRLIAGSGTTGLYGEAIMIDVATGEILRRFRGHRDLIYSVAVTTDEKWLATAGYDRKSILWNVNSDRPVREFLGHNDAVFENVFDPSGERLVTASADATVKIWRVADATRLDTRGEPLKEQYTTAVSPDGQWIVAGGEDNRIRKWKLVSTNPNQTNPLKIARFAHESAIQLLRFHDDGQHLVSVASDGSIKIWDSTTLTQIHQFESFPEGVQSIALGRAQMVIGMMDGSLQILAWPAEKLSRRTESARQASTVGPTKVSVGTSAPTPTKMAEVEPNNDPPRATIFEAPADLSGTIESAADVDLYRFKALQGQRWIVECKADAPKTIDTHVSVLNSEGQPVPRVLLRAVRDSYFTFRGKDSIQTADFRVHNWEEMKLNQYLYCNGEVVKLFHYPRGPDSGFNVYPNFGKRHAMFDTTPITHALHEPCFIVEPHPPGTEFPATGLPQFLLNFENDDDSQQEMGTDSRLTFIAPEDGDYVVRVRDARDFGGETFSYQLSVRPESPGFAITDVIGEKPTLARGSYKRVGITLDRMDNFSDPVSIELVDLPAGVTALGPITVENNGLQAFFTLHVDQNAPDAGGEAPVPSIIAKATIRGREFKHSKPLGAIKITDPPKLRVHLKHAPKQMPHYDAAGLPVLEIRPGETITAQVAVTRAGYDQRVNFGKENAAINVPFGIYIDNIGLNGVLIPPDENRRTFFLTAEDWVQPGSRLVFLEAEEAGRPASNPAVLRVLPPRKNATKTERH